MTRNFLVFALAGALAGFVGFACKSGGGGSQAPGDVTAIEGPSSCPRSVPRAGASCPRGESEFCVYRTTGGDFACVCGGGKWGCGAK
ncbi:hypothetical protein [Nannocystis radixulma]|uniref:EGF-like domain-containing protein n=1 Tax=Nannocystis radixulma TaxID=2995305 RepID=A0ABT5BGA3_9BACT|nr:hypothetical protein [Nannocystis radixulma]MDC0673166.1 hypothetical protein [Nannocystis radixulma]